MSNRFPVAERIEKQELPRAQFAKPILVDDEEHSPYFPVGRDWAEDFYEELGGEG